MSSDSVSRHRSPAHQQPCRSMAQQGALVRGGGLRLRDQCSGGSLPDSRQRMLNECPANSQRGLVSEQEGRSRAKFSMYARIGQAGPRPLRALISGSVRCATPILLRSCIPSGSTRGAPKVAIDGNSRRPLRDALLSSAERGTCIFCDQTGHNRRELGRFHADVEQSLTSKEAQIREDASHRSDSLTHLSETSASFRIRILCLQHCRCFGGLGKLCAPRLFGRPAVVDAIFER